MTVQALIGSVESLLQQHEELLVLEEKKQLAIMKDDTNLLIELTNKESRLVKQISETEKRRVQSARALLDQLGIMSDPNPQVSDIVSYLTSANDKLKLTELTDRLVSILGQLKQLNELNLRLAEQALEFNHFSIELLTGSFEQDFTYSKPDASSGKSKANLFDSKA
ncbi:flagellar protein FlgN [Cohnella pontilimi]|uniref:flagellar protein FlgN n=1 Tax=Cohnella pontilimi TaxID=2564100 RepID=UPI00145E6ED7|nr:flagellar protein FlgN [Cohnella pontilimi]